MAILTVIFRWCRACPFPRCPIAGYWMAATKRASRWILIDDAARQALLAIVRDRRRVHHELSGTAGSKIPRSLSGSGAAQSALDLRASYRLRRDRGRLRTSPGYDMTAYWARSGLMQTMHNADAEPSQSPAGFGDHPTSMALFGGIMLGLYRREITGQGNEPDHVADGQRRVGQRLRNSGGAGGRGVPAEMDAHHHGEPDRESLRDARWPALHYLLSRSEKRLAEPLPRAGSSGIDRRSALSGRPSFAAPTVRSWWRSSMHPWARKTWRNGKRFCDRTM